ncbi:cyclin-domain-containing protein [Basidiobolus meristosporus CBS 931.73]|uniref:Cyclin-domain-containing protein n=1 Tax=Basidiobolus meristosporus CBS 931.73 TaxID=1314790 RepID=A0A1Y1XTD0_9FUNG|nr:cyclin-domain-containing protein [Basidiobolus meristosporus CBS 931.73]|eukprot:ORX88766.1 cyclin-domain-containing protein [Basidiobolus meristosporus CBS 931.73]
MIDIAKLTADQMVLLVSRYLKAQLKKNDGFMDSKVTLFHSSSIPDISIKSYIRRIQKFVPFGNDTLLAILIYLERAIKSADGILVNSYTIHRLLITSITIANKFFSDVIYPNSRYAKVGGLPLHEMNKLEVELLFMIDFNLNISPKDFAEYTHRLLSYGVNDISKSSSSVRARQRLVSMTSVPEPKPRETATYAAKRRHSLHNVSHLDGTSELAKLVSQVKETILTRQPSSTLNKEPEILKSAKDRLRSLLSNRKSNPYQESTRASYSEHPSCRVNPVESAALSYKSLIGKSVNMVKVPI